MSLSRLLFRSTSLAHGPVLYECPLREFPHGDLQIAVISSNELLHVALAKTKFPWCLQSRQGPQNGSPKGYPHGQSGQSFPRNRRISRMRSIPAMAISDHKSDRRYVVPLD
jgi:hypothetical protein